MNIHPAAMRRMKQLLWLYFWLLIFEGALRKWVVPGLSTPLLIIRDPVVILIYFQAMTLGIFPKNGYIRWIVVLAVLSFFASLAGIGTLKVTLYGLRTNFLHLPLIFLIPKIFDYEDVKNIGKWLLVLSIPMAGIAFLQFRAPPDAWINAGAGGETGGQLTAALGRIRPSGTFSFVTGMVSYLSLVAAFLAHHFVDRRIYPKTLVYASIVALAVSLLVSGSRSAVACVAIVVVMVVFIGLRRGVMSISYLWYAVVFYVVYLGLKHVPIFREGLMVHQERFEGSGGLNEGIIDRFFGELLSSFNAIDTTPILGFGLGLGTNAGAAIVSGIRQFLLSEGEWGRVILESGPLLGLAFIGLRFGIMFEIVKASLRAFRVGNSLPLLIFSASGIDLVTGQFGQPTALGFVVFASGLCLVPASREESPADEKPVEHEPIPGKIRGRSRYAEVLHGGEEKGKP